MYALVLRTVKRAFMILSGSDLMGFVQHCNGAKHERQNVYYANGLILSRMNGAEKYHRGYCLKTSDVYPSLSRYLITYKAYLRLTRKAPRKVSKVRKPHTSNNKFTYKPYKGRN